MKRKNSSTKNKPRDPFVAGFILPVLILATFSPVLMFQGDGDIPGETYIPPVETAEQKYARMISAFDRENTLPGVLIVSFTQGTTLEQANAILQSFNLSIDQKQICNAGQAVEPNGTTIMGEETCFSDGWYDMLASGRVLVSSGQEKVLAEQLYNTPGIVWVEPDYTVTLDGENPALGGTDEQWLEATNPPGSGEVPSIPSVPRSDATNTVMGINTLWLVVGVLVVGFGAYFVMGKK